MINKEEYMEITILLRQGKSIREIARLMGLSRNTVRRYIRRGIDPCYLRRKERGSKLAPYRDYLRQRINEAHPHWLPAVVLYREILTQGYTGKLTVLRDYLRTLKGPPREEDPVIRFETSPGQQMQMDWLEFGRGKGHLSAFVATLGYSRYSYVEFVSDETLETLLRCHEHAFEYFGGVPEEVLYDNMKTVVLERNHYGKGQHRFHPSFLDFAKHYGFVPRLCRPYRAKTKGKIERFNRYVRYSFYNPLSSRLKGMGLKLDCKLANDEVKRWLRDIANCRVHATTGKIPAELLEGEKLYLLPLPNSYPGLKGAMPVMSASLGQEGFSFQHPLSVYQALLEEVRA